MGWTETRRLVSEKLCERLGVASNGKTGNSEINNACLVPKHDTRVRSCLKGGELSLDAKDLRVLN